MEVLSHFRYICSNRILCVSIHCSFFVLAEKASLRAVWPDLGIQCSPIFPKVAQNVAKAVLTLRVVYFKIAPNVTKYLGSFLWKHLLPGSLKNRPIWSHWLRGCFCCSIIFLSFQIFFSVKKCPVFLFVAVNFDDLLCKSEDRLALLSGSKGGWGLNEFKCLPFNNKNKKWPRTNRFCAEAGDDIIFHFPFRFRKSENVISTSIKNFQLPAILNRPAGNILLFVFTIQTIKEQFCWYSNRRYPVSRIP